MRNLKTFAVVLFCALSSVATAQTRTDTIEYKPPYSDLLPIKCIRTVPYKTINGERKVEGTVTIEGKGGWDAGQHNDNQQYSEKRTYAQGMLNGPYRQSYRHNGNGVAGGRYKINRGWSVEGQFSDGQPEGQWTFALDSKYNSPDDRSNTVLRELVTFNDGRVMSITDQDGNTITIDDKGLIDGRGHIKGGDKVTMKKNVITNIYTDATGETRSTTKKEQQLIDRFIDGKETLFTLADKGYTIDYQEVFLAQWARYAEHCDRYARIKDFAPRFNVPKYTVSIGRLTEIETVRDEAAVEYYRQRNKEYDNLKTYAHYATRYGKRYLSSNAEREIDRQWRIDQERALSRMLVSLSQMQRDKKLAGCDSDEGAIYEIIDRKDTASTGSTRCVSVFTLLDQAFEKVGPVIGCQIDSIRWMPYHGYIADCRVNQLRADSIGYNSYATRVRVDYNGHISLEQLAAKQYRKIPNIWDTVDDRELVAKQRHNALLETCSSIKSWRDEYVIAFENMLSDRTPKAHVRLKDLAEMDSLQRQLEGNIALYEQIDEGNRSAHRYMNFRKLTSLYDAMMKEADVEWSDNAERLQKVIDMQKRYLDLLKNNPPEDLERAANLERVKTALELIEKYKH